MPQLDTIYIFLTYLWTWLIIFLTVQKVKTFMITSSPKKHMTNQPTPTRPWM